MELYYSLEQKLNNQQDLLKHLISEVGDYRYSTRPPSGKWSIQEHVVHLVTYQPIFLDRIHQIVNGNSPQFERYNAEADPGFAAGMELTKEELFMKMETDRREIVRVVKSLSYDQLNKIGVHRKFGELSLIQWLEFFVLHESHHYFTIYQLTHDVEW